MRSIWLSVSIAARSTYAGLAARSCKTAFLYGVKVKTFRKRIDQIRHSQQVMNAGMLLVKSSKFTYAVG